MDYYKHILAQLDSLAEAFPEYVKICKRYNIPQGLVLGSILGVFSLVLLIF